MESARHALSRTIRRLDRARRDGRSNHVLHLALFALALFFLVYFWARVSRLLAWAGVL